MNYIVLDLEWNQSNSDSKARKDSDLPVFEIIEIGAVKLNKNKEIVEKIANGGFDKD